MPNPTPLDDLVTGPTPGAIDYGAPPQSAASIAKAAGFPVAPPGAGNLMAPKPTYQLPQKTRINPVTGTTEIIPGGFDLIENMLKQYVLPAQPYPPGTGGVRG